MTKEHVNTNHTFAICAYKESPYLEECITSLMEQTVKSEIFIATSTPNKYIDDIAAKYNLKVYVNEGESGITQDWNFAYSKVQTDYVTIAHQDDKYAPEYVENLLAYTAKAKKPLLFFTDYAEIRNGEIVTSHCAIERPIENIPALASPKKRLITIVITSVASAKHAVPIVNQIYLYLSSGVLSTPIILEIIFIYTS